jgi:hypothetical protein
MPERSARNFIRVLIGVALCIALAAAGLARPPAVLPAVAFGQASLYRLEIALLVFYGSLLLVTPTFSGLARGRLPTEISTRGAKFAENADQLVESDEATTRKLEGKLKRLSDDMAEVRLEIFYLKGAGDNR